MLARITNIEIRCPPDLVRSKHTLIASHTYQGAALDPRLCRGKIWRYTEQ